MSSTQTDIIKVLTPEEESRRRRELFEAYMNSPEMAEKRLQRLKINDAGDNNAEARAMIWELCRREDNPAEGCIFFIENFCWTFDPRKEPAHIPFVLFDFQKDAVRWLIDHIDNGKDALIEKSRDMGVTWIVDCVFLWYWLFDDGVNLLMGSYKEKLVDDKTDDSLIGRIAYNINQLPKWLIPKGYNPKKHRTHLKIVNPANNNLIAGESMSPEFGTGMRKTAVFFDELGAWDYAQAAWRTCGDVTGCRIANSTPKGYNFYAKLREGKHGNIDVLTLRWEKHPLKDRQWYAFELTRRDPIEVAQELDISYHASQEGRVYPEWNDNNIEYGEYEYDPGLPLYVGWDFGKTDDTAIIWAQPFDSKLRIIDTYARSGKNIDFFIPFITGIIPSDTYTYSTSEHELIRKHQNWKRGVHFGDPAGRFKNGVTDATVLSVLRESGIMVNYKDSWKEHQNRKRAAKAIISGGIQLNINPRTDEFNSCMENAAYPTPTIEGMKEIRSQKPKHDWTSHYRSSFEYLSLGLSEYTLRMSKPRDMFEMKENHGRRRALRY